MEILIDSRETSPLKFNSPYITTTTRIKLDFGDYQAKFKDGYIPPVSFERKALGDLFSTLSKGYPRFKKEINRSVKAESLLVIIVECNLTRILKGYRYSKRSGSEITKQLFTLMIKHHIPFVCCKDRKEISEYITRTFVALGEQYMRGKKKKK